jgi:hypothetical protein
MQGVRIKWPVKQMASNCPIGKGSPRRSCMPDIWATNIKELGGRYRTENYVKGFSGLLVV